jgi:putative DNA primase/helicase
VLAVAEGLETAFAVMEGMKMPVWCAVNAHLLENFYPPPGVSQILVFADKDRPSAQHPRGHGQESAKRLVQRLWERGIKASAIVPAGEIPAGQRSLDWLDILNRDGKAGFPSLQSVEHAMRRVA